MSSSTSSAANAFPTAWVSAAPYLASAEHISEYIDVTGHRAVHEGDELLAPAIYAVLPTQQLVERVLLQVLGKPLVAVGSVHGEQDISFCRPISAGMRIYCRSRVIGIRRKRTGTVTTTQTHTRDEHGRTLNWQYASHFCRYLDWPENTGRSAPKHPTPREPFPAPIETVSTYVPPDVTVGYANVSDDYSPFHISHDAAIAAGFRGIIVHGLLLMAMATQAVGQMLCAEDQSLTRVAVRFTQPLTPGQHITTRLVRTRESPPRGATFDVIDSAGNAVLTNGWARLGATVRDA